MRYTTRIIVPPRIRRSGPPGSPGGAYGPQVLGMRRTFGFGDRLGVATPAHLAVAAAHPEFAPVFAQQSVEEMTLTARTPADVMGGAARVASAARLRQPWGADADRLHTAQEVANAAEAGFTCFTFDPYRFVQSGVDALDASELQGAVDALVAVGDLTDHWSEPYLDRTIDLPGGHRLRIGLEPLQRAVARYLPAIVHCVRLSSALARSSQGRPLEVEVALDRVDAPATALDHLFIGLELEARGVKLTGLALRHTEGFGVEDAEGTAASRYEQALREHVAVAEFCGPYKLCFYEGPDPMTVYPIIGRTCGEALHVKSSAASYLAALRVAAQVDPEWFCRGGRAQHQPGRGGCGVRGPTLHPGAGGRVASKLPGRTCQRLAGRPAGTSMPGRRLWVRADLSPRRRATCLPGDAPRTTGTTGWPVPRNHWCLFRSANRVVKRGVSAGKRDEVGSRSDRSE